MTRFYLIPEFDGRQSFYNKAVVQIEDNNKKLFSYETLVAEIKNNQPIVYNVQSSTTLRHVKEFLKQNNFKADTKQQISNDYMK